MAAGWRVAADWGKGEVVMADRQEGVATVLGPETRQVFTC